MPTKSVKQDKKESPKNPVTSRGSNKIKKYFDIRIFTPELPKTQAAIAAGYSRSTPTDDIESTDQYKHLQAEHQKVLESLKLPIEQRIREAQERTGFTAAKCLHRLNSIIDNGKDRDATAAAKTGTEITGERMPERIEHTVAADEEIIRKLCSE